MSSRSRACPAPSEGGCDSESGSGYHAPPHVPHGTPAGPRPPPPPTRGHWVRFGPVAPLGRGHAGARRAGGPFSHFASPLQAYADACGAAGRRPRAPGAARRWGSRTQCEWVPCVGSPCNGALFRAWRSGSGTAATVTVTFRGSNITGRGSNRPVSPTPDPARPGGVGEHQRRAALRPPASSRPPNIGQMRVLNQLFYPLSILPHGTFSFTAQ